MIAAHWLCLGETVVCWSAVISCWVIQRHLWKRQDRLFRRQLNLRDDYTRLEGKVWRWHDSSRS